ncbi:MAG: Na+/H+ antiporter subunit B [Vicinamibacterales bacterium]|nr:Na+/H+ antiporter subunit B [Vicinamibacterales bacterium]
MFSLILSTTARAIMPLTLVFSVYLLMRGHNAPGGGFVGGLIAAVAFAIASLADGVATARRALVVDPRRLMAVGLALALASGFGGVAAGQPFLTGQWAEVMVPVVGKIGTPLVFDVGVYLAVLGVSLTMLFALSEED